MVLNISYMFCELIAGILGNSLTLLGDSFHMMTDSISLVVGFVSIKLGYRKDNPIFTFGYKRAEVLGAFFNASFLISVAFFMVTEIIQKYIEPEPVDQVDLVLYTAIGGFVINLIGMFLFHEHGDDDEHHHHGCCHKHSHAEGSEQHCHHHEHHHHEHHHHEHEKQHKRKSRKQHDMATRGVFLHVMGDFIGSIIAIISGLV